MIETILFDLSEVCLQGLLGVEKKIVQYINGNEKQVKQFLGGIKLIHLFEGKISEEEYLTGFLEESKYDLSMDYLKSTIRNNFTEIPGTKQIIEHLNANNLQLGLLSDHSKEWIEYIESKYDFLQLFDQRCYSFDSGYTKHKSQSFQYAIDKLHADPSKTLFIDDLANNLVVAQSAGIQYVHNFTNAESLKKELVNFGIGL